MAEQKEGRKIIFECVTGSKLYGTNNENSDDDYTGIFLPSRADILGLQNPPTEWAMNERNTTGPRNSAGDVDRKYFSLAKWLKMAADGQSWAVEMLFVPKEKITIRTPEWDEVNDNGILLLSKKSVAGVVGFALAQSHKSSIRGDNLNKIREVIEIIDSYEENEYRRARDGKKLKVKDIMAQNPAGCWLKAKGFETCVVPAKSTKIEVVNGQDNTPMFEVAGRQFNLGRDIKFISKQLKYMESRYGTRTQNAAAAGVDWKSLYHAYRLVFEAKELLSTKFLTLPRPKEEVDFLMKIRRQEYFADFREELQAHITDIKQNYEPNSELPNKPDWSRLNRLCQEIMHAHIMGAES